MSMITSKHFADFRETPTSRSKDCLDRSGASSAHFHRAGSVVE